ncbi:MAG: dethiobiotin synthase [Bacteroidales bacterium 52_46]|nr:MAG: dethiobiotin synthase [Bacteroidales bacterium 52_46]
MDKETIFVTGIDTDAGKSYATGWLANQIAATGRSVMTQKFVQTGNEGRSEDIELHRRIMHRDMAAEEYALTAPMIFTYPSSPHLAARVDGREVDIKAIDEARKTLEERYDTLLVEGAGGMMVPLTERYLTIDYITDRRLDVALVTNAKLGSISHTLLALEAIERRGLNLRYLLYNTHFDTDPVIAPETRSYIRNYVAEHFPAAEWLDVPSITF